MRCSPRLLKVVQKTLLLQIPGAYGRQFHQAQAPVLAAELDAYAPELAELRLKLSAQERIFDADFLKLGGEGGVAAMVAPVGVQYAELRLGRGLASRQKNSSSARSSAFIARPHFEQKSAYSPGCMSMKPSSDTSGLTSTLSNGRSTPRSFGLDSTALI